MMKILVFLSALFFLVSYSFGKSKKRVSRGGGNRGISSVEAQKPLEVHGQTRNLNMLLKLQSEREQIDFIKLRKKYEDEIENLNY